MTTPHVSRNPIKIMGCLLGVLLSCSALLPTRAAAQESMSDLEWPQSIEVEQGSIVIYEPQIESVTEDQLEARSAVAVTTAGAEGPTFGAMWFRARLETDRDTRMVTLTSVKVLNSKFADLDSTQIAGVTTLVEREVPKWDIEFSMDRLVAGMDAAGEAHTSDDGLGVEPPRIIYRSSPAVLVLIDGDPILTDMEGYELQLLVNSAYFIVQDQASRIYYLHGEQSWYASSDLYSGWIPSPDLPAEVQRVDQVIQEEAAKAEAEAGPEDPGTDDEDEEPLPELPTDVEIIVSSTPAELVVSDGEPDFATIEGTSLLYLRNTESDLVMDISDQLYYVLLSGRWYASKSLEEGPWSFVAFEDLPSDFALIPDDSDMGSVRSSVPGTTESREAVLDNTIPQTAEVDRKTATCSVSYDGDPQFEACGGGEVHHAINTDKTVLLIDGRYYCCDEAVWFVSDTPQGGWAVATELPAVIQDLPADCPAYNTKYVYIYDSTPEVVYVGYTPAYYGSYIYGPCVVYGTGWYYRPWWGHYYYPRAVTYGFGVHYNPWTGWGFSFGVSYGWLNIRVGRPWYGGWWGRGGYRHGYRHGYYGGRHVGYRQGFRAGYRQGQRAGYRAGYRNATHHSNTYKNRTNGVRHTQNRKQERPKTNTRPAGGDRASQTDRSGSRNDVYTDRDGNVYRKDGDKWEKREGNEWKDSDLGSSDRTREGDRSTREGDATTREGDRSTREGSSTTREGSGDRSTTDRSTTDRSTQDRSTTDRSQQGSSQDRSSADRSSSGGSSREGSSANRSQQGNNSNRQQQLNRDAQSRNRGSQKSQSYNSNRSRSGGSRGGGGRRR